MNIGKKILSAFVELAEETKPVSGNGAMGTNPATPVQTAGAESGKFQQHFEQLFAEANKPGPDYYEFSRMVTAMQTIADEQARYLAAFAGLSVQGLDKQKLLESASGYLQVVETDAAAFQQTLDAMLIEKVQHKQEELEAKSQRIGQLSQEITELHNQIAMLQKEVDENKEKIGSNSSGYRLTAENMKTKIGQDMERIKQYLG
jgi:chromosome segregation ATPase